MKFSTLLEAWMLARTMAVLGFLSLFFTCLSLSRSLAYVGIVKLSLRDSFTLLSGIVSSSRTAA